MAKGRKRGRHYAARAKINLILTNPRAILIYIFLVAFLLSRPGIWAYFTDIKTATNNFSIIATYVVSFDPNGGEGNMGSQTISYNFPTPLEENTYTKEGYTFNGWNTQADGLGTSFQDMQQVLNIDFPDINNIILYAQWEEDTDAVAITNGVYYNTLQEAINAVPDDNTQTTVTLLKDVSENLTVSAGKNIKFVLNDHTISVEIDPVFEINGIVEINDGKILKTGVNTAAVNVNVGGTLFVTGGQIINTSEGGKQAIYNLGGSVYISGGYMENACKAETAGTNKRGAVHNKNGLMVITGGSIVAKNYIGVQNEANLIIGTKDGNPDPSTPVIQGGTYGLSNTVISNQHGLPAEPIIFDMYNGTLKGKISATDDENLIDDKEDGYVLAHRGETIDEEVYVAAYLALETKTVTFNPNGGQVEESSRAVETGHPVGSLPIPHYTNKEFVGWFTQQTGGTEVTPTTNITDDITIYAHWTDPVVCMVDGTEYPSVNEAIKHIHNHTQTTITIMSDLELNTADKITVGNNKLILLDLNGHTIQNRTGQNMPIIENSGTLEIIGGTIRTSATQGAINNKNGTVTINGITVEATGARQALYVEKGTANIIGGATLSSAAADRAAIQTLANGTINLIDGTIISTNQNAVENAGTINIGTSDGNINTTTPIIIGKKNGVNKTGGTVNFYDGTIKAVRETIVGEVNAIEANSHRQPDFEIIDGITYVTEFLVSNN